MKKQFLNVKGKLPFFSRNFFIISAVCMSAIFSNCKKETIREDEKVETSANKLNNAETLSIPTKAQAITALNVYNNTYYNQYGTYGSSYKSRYWKDTNQSVRMSFWTEAEAIETLIDAYHVNPTTAIKNKIQYLYNGMRDAHGTLWTNNQYNDDVIWGAIMCVRAYEIWNDGGMIAMAKNNFDLVWNRGWDTGTLGGGIWWTTDNLTKNTCVNAPAVICAMRIYQATGDVSYKNKAKLIMDWMVSNLYNSSTGLVKGAINPAGNITQGPLLYTQGTFIGAANELRTEYSTPNYQAMGAKAMDYARSNLSQTTGGILNDESNTLDTQGGKSIFARWACIFVAQTGTASNYGAWLDLNATQAWSIRNSSGLMWHTWGTRTSDTDVLKAWPTNGGVSMMLNLYRFR